MCDFAREMDAATPWLWSWPTWDPALAAAAHGRATRLGRDDLPEPPARWRRDHDRAQWNLAMPWLFPVDFVAGELHRRDERRARIMCQYCGRKGCRRCRLDVPWTERKGNRRFIEALIRWHR